MLRLPLLQTVGLLLLGAALGGLFVAFLDARGAAAALGRQTRSLGGIAIELATLRNQMAAVQE